MLNLLNHENEDDSCIDCWFNCFLNKTVSHRVRILICVNQIDCDYDYPG